MSVPQHPELAEQLCNLYGFPPLPCKLATSNGQQNLEVCFRASVQNAAGSTLMLRGNRVVQDLEAQPDPGRFNGASTAL